MPLHELSKLHRPEKVPECVLHNEQMREHGFNNTRHLIGLALCLSFCRTNGAGDSVLPISEQCFSVQRKICVISKVPNGQISLPIVTVSKCNCLITICTKIWVIDQ